MSSRRVLVVASGAPLATRTDAICAALADAGWSLSAAATPDALNWIDVDAVHRLVGDEIRTAHRPPGAVSRPAPPDAVVLCPATFNTLNKLAAGFADTYALAALCECLGASIPMLIVPMVNDRLWRHPAWLPSLSTLASTGAAFMDVHSGGPEPRPVTSGGGDDVVATFDPIWIVRALAAAIH